MSREQFERDGIILSGVDVGSGYPVVFQHGLGADEAQVAEIFPEEAGLRRLTLECRAQGGSEPGPAQALSIATFAEDVLAFCDARGVSRFAVGGISMGAAIALRIAVKAPERVSKLVLARPAWLWSAAPETMRPFVEVAALLRRPDAQAGLAAFQGSATGQALARDAPDNFASLCRFFAVRDREVTAELLAGIAADGPGVSEADIGALSVPTLVIGHAIDSVHPLGYARMLAERIATAHLVEITPKAVDRLRYVEEFRAALAHFLREPG